MSEERILKWERAALKGSLKLPSEPLGKGGEGAVYSVDMNGENPFKTDLVAKMYFNPLDGDRENKVTAMVMKRPKSSSLAWPLAIIRDEKGLFAGFLMKKINNKEYREWATLANAADRKKEAPSFDVKYALTAAANLGLAISAVHSAGHIVGDINESNIFVSNSSKVMLVDTDSFQISGNSGKIYPCVVGKAEYTAAELTGNLRDHKRTPKTDSFGYAVAVWQIITGGSLPTDSVYQGEGDPPGVTEKIRKGIFPSFTNVSKYQAPKRVPVKATPVRLRKAILHLLHPDPSRRGNVQDLSNAIKDILPNLKRCGRVKNHWFDERDGKKCGWCEHLANTGSDPWGKTKTSGGEQITLPGLNFKDPKKREPKVKRQGKNRKPSSVRVKRDTSKGSGSKVKPKIIYPETPELKGGKTLLYSGDSKIKRPPLKEVLNQDKKLFFYCLNAEFPGIFKAWWNKDQRKPSLVASIIGFFLGLIVSAQWVNIPIWVSGYIPDNWPSWISGKFLFYFTDVAVISSVLAVTFLFFSFLYGFMNVSKEEKGLPENTIMARMNPIGGILRFPFVSLFWGPLGLIGLIIWVLIIVITFIIEEFSKPSNT